MAFRQKIVATSAPASVLLVRLAVGAVFLSEGVQKFLFPAVPLIIDMLVAISTTKIPMLLKSGFWATAHEARVDFAMLLCLLFLLAVGAGPWSADARLSSEPTAGESS